MSISAEDYRAGMGMYLVSVGKVRGSAIEEGFMGYERQRAEAEERRNLRRCGENPDEYVLHWEGLRSLEWWEDEVGEWQKVPLEEAGVVGDALRVLPKALAARFGW